MADLTVKLAETDVMPAANPSARNLVPLPVLAKLGQRSDWRGSMQLAAHSACIAATGFLVWVARPYWVLLIPAMALHGITIVTLFAPMHECVHRTAFASRWANDAVGWIAGVLGFYNATYYRHFHAWHHRYTQDPERDPELIFPKAKNLREYVTELSGFTFWWRRIQDYPRLAFGLARDLPFVPESARHAIALSMSAQLAIYLAALVAIGFGYDAVSDLLVHSRIARTAVSARPARRRAHRMQPGPERADEYADDRSVAPDPPFDLEHAIPRRAPPLSSGAVSSPAGAARSCARQAAIPRVGLSRRQPRDRAVAAIVTPDYLSLVAARKACRICVDNRNWAQQLADWRRIGAAIAKVSHHAEQLDPRRTAG